MVVERTVLVKFSVLVKFRVLVTVTYGEVVVTTEVAVLVFVLSSAGATMRLVEIMAEAMTIAAARYAWCLTLDVDSLLILAVHRECACGDRL